MALKAKEEKLRTKEKGGPQQEEKQQRDRGRKDDGRSQDEMLLVIQLWHVSNKDSMKDLGNKEERG